MLVALACRKSGAPENFVKLQVEAWRQARFHVKTGFGVSNEWYEHTEEKPLFGTLQGGKGSPDYWNHTNSLAINAFAEGNSGATFADPFDECCSYRPLDAFVDDTTLISNNFRENLMRPPTLVEMVETANQINQRWERCLSTTGGKLNFDKCLTYLLSWKFAESGQPQLRSKREIEEVTGVSPISFTDTSGRKATIQHKDISEWHRSLGIRIQPNLSRTDEIARIKQKCNEFAEKFKYSRLSREEATLAWRTIAVPSISYAIHTFALTKKEWREIQSRLTQCVASACGFNRCTPKQVVQAPAHCGGCGFGDFFAIQGAHMVSTLITHLRHGGEVGKLLQIYLQWFQRLLGTESLSIRNPGQRMDYMPGRWIQSLCSFLQEAKLSINVPIIKIPQARRENDKMIMETAVEAGMQRNELCKLNWCRLFLKVEWLSEITTSDGKYLLPTLNETIPRVTSRSTSRWPVQEFPGPRSWGVFRKFLRSITERRSRKLINPLGKWINLSGRLWSFYWEVDSGMIAMAPPSGEQKWQVFLTREHPGGRVKFNLDDPPFDSDHRIGKIIPTDVKQTMICEQRYGITEPPPDNDYGRATKQELATSWTEFLNNEPIWSQTLLDKTSINNPTTLMQSIINGDIIAASCGAVSSCKKKGSFTWNILTAGGTTVASGWGHVHGSEISESKCRAYGTLASVAFLNRYTNFYGIYNNCKSNRVIASDNMTNDYNNMVTRGRNSPRIFMKHNTEIMLAIQDEFTSMGGANKLLTPESRVNEQWWKEWQRTSKKTARTALGMAMDMKSAMPEIPAARAYLLNRDQLMVDTSAETLIRTQARAELQKYLADRWEWSEEITNEMAWKEREAALALVSENFKRFIVKTSIGWLCTNHKRKKWGMASSDMCDACNEVETNNHLFQCTANASFRNDVINTVSQVANKIGTDPRIHHDLIQLLKDPKDTMELRTNGGRVAASAGAMNLWRGFIPLPWVRQQRLFDLEANKKQRTEAEDRWAVKMIVALWEANFQIWDNRNSRIHDNPENQREREETKERMRSAKEALQSIPWADRAFMEGQLHNEDVWTVETMKTWIENAQKIIRKAKSEENQRQTRMDISKWFRQGGSSTGPQLEERDLRQRGGTMGTRDKGTSRPQAEANDSINRKVRSQAVLYHNQENTVQFKFLGDSSPGFRVDSWVSSDSCSAAG
jgi:hypothetical protein